MTAATVEDFRRETWTRETPGGLVAYTLDELLAVRFPARRPLLCRNETAIFREGHLGEVYASRGVGKTWFLQTLALVASARVEALGFRAPEASSVLYVDGEMSSEEIKERFANLRTLTGATEPNPRLTILGADWQDTYLSRLDTAEGQAALASFVDPAELIILDNRSCLFDPEAEKDGAAWGPAQDWLLSLRRRGKGVITAHHANRQGGARGHSRPEDVMDILLKLSRPEGYSQEQGARFIVEFEKARGVHGAACVPFVAALTSSGWTIEGASEAAEDAVSRKIIDYLAVASKLGELPKSANAVVRGAEVNRARGLQALAELKRLGRVVDMDGYRLG